VGGHWKYLYRAVDRVGEIVDALLTAKRDVAAARRFLERAIDLNGGWRQLGWPVDDNYLGRFCTGTGPVRRRGLT